MAITQEMIDRINELSRKKKAEGLTEELKAGDPMAWVQRMNNIHAKAEEIVRKELIFV